MRDRLIELCGNVIDSCKSSLCADCEHNNIDYPHCMAVHFADYLLANGVIVPPCKVGDKVFCKIANEIEGFVVTNRTIRETAVGVYVEYTSSNGTYPMDFDSNCIGGKVFLTKEEAEAKLKGEREWKM